MSSSVGDMWFTLGMRDLATDEIKKVSTALEKLRGNVTDFISVFDKEGRKSVENLASYQKILGQIDAKLSELSSRKVDAIRLKTDTSELDKATKALEEFRKTLVESGVSKDFDEPFKATLALVGACVKKQDEYDNAVRRTYSDEKKLYEIEKMRDTIANSRHASRAEGLDLENLRKARKRLESLEVKVNEGISGDEYASETAAIRALISAQEALIHSKRAEFATNEEELAQLRRSAEIKMRIAELESLRAKSYSISSDADTSSIDKAVDMLKKYEAALGTDSDTPQSYALLNTEIRQCVANQKDLNELTKQLAKESENAKNKELDYEKVLNLLETKKLKLLEIERQSKNLDSDTTFIERAIQELDSAEQKIKQSGVAPSTKEYQAAISEINKMAEFQRDVNKEKEETLDKDRKIARILGQISKISSLAKRSNALNLDTSKLNEAIDKLRRFKNALDMGAGGTGKKPYNTLIASIRELIKEQEREVVAAEREMRAKERLNASNERLVKSSKMLSDLKVMASQYVSVFAAAQAIHSIINIGGQFEQQHIALQNILGDLGEAKILYGQLKDLAIESPFTFLQLSSYTKQLAAFSVPYEELYDTTKRLADMSAGLGVDMNRLILVYGQVRSAAVLRGQELRQFTEAGIPMVEKLAQKFTELNGKLVTTGDVFELISRRKVPFEMVKDILFEMTNEGGQFYNMQAKLTDTTLGQAQKLKDSWEVMLGTLADSTNATGALLKELLGSLSYVVSNLSSIAPMIIGFGVGKGVQSIGKGINLNVKKYQNNRLSEIHGIVESGAVRNKAGEMMKIATYETLLNQKKLNAEMLRTLYLEDKSLKSTICHLAERKAITAEERHAILYSNKFQAVMEKTRVTAAAIGRSIGNFFKANMFSFVAGGLAEIVSSITNKIMEFDDITEKVSSQSLSSFHKFDKLELAGGNTMEGINQIKNALKDIYDTAKVEEYISSLDGVKEQYNAWIEVLNGVKEAQEALKDTNVVKDLQNATTYGIEWWKGFSPLSETFKEQMTSLEEDVDNLAAKSRDTTIQLGKKAIDRAIEGAFANAKEFKAELDNLQTSAEKVAHIMGSGEFSEFYTFLGKEGVDQNLMDKLFSINSRDMTKTMTALKKARSSFMEGLEDYDKKLQDAGKKSFFDNNLDKMAKKWEKLSLQEKTEIQKVVKVLLEEIGQGRHDIINMLINPINAKVPIYITPYIDVDPIAKLQGFQKTYLQRYLQGDMPNGANGWGKTLSKETNSLITKAGRMPTTFADYQKQQRELWNAAKETKKQYEALLSKGNLSDGAKKDAQENIATANEDIKSAERAASDFGFTLEENKKKNSTDAWLKSFNKQLSNYERYYNNYKKYQDLYGEDKAKKKLKKEGAPEFTMDKEILYQTQLDKLKKAGLTTEDRKAKYIELQNKLIDAQREKEEKAVRDRIAAVNKELAIIRETYDNYQKIRKLTGNTKLAASLTGATENKTLGDALKTRLTKALEESGSKYTAKQVIAMTESEREKTLGKDYGVLEILKQIDENLSNIKKEDFDIMVKAMEDALTLQQKQDAENSDYEKKKGVINKITDESAKASALAALETTHKANLSKLAWEDFKSKPKYAQIFENTDNLGSKAIDNLVELLENLISTVKDSPDSMKSLQDSLDKLRNAQLQRNPFGSVAREFSNRMNTRGAYNEVYSKLKKDGKQNDLTKKIELDRDYGKTFKKGKSYSLTDIQNELQKSESKFSQAIENCSKVINDFQSAFEPLISLLGSDGSIADAITSTFEQFNATDSGITEMGTALKGLGLEGVGSALLTASPYIAAGMAALNLGEKVFGSLFSDGEAEKYERMVGYLEDLRNIVSDIKSEVAEEIDITRSASKITDAYAEYINLQNDMISSERKTAAQYLKANGGGTSSSSAEHRMNERIREATSSNIFSGASTIWDDIAKELAEQKMGVDGSIDAGDLWNMSADQLKYIKKTHYSDVWANLDDEYREYLENIIKYGDELADMELQRIEALTGTTFDSIQSEMVDLLASSNADTTTLVNSFEENLKKALLNSLVYDNYKTEIEQLLTEIADARADGTFEEKVESFIERYKKIVGEMEDDAEEITEKFKKTFENMDFSSIQSEWTSMLSSLDYSNRDFADSFESYVKQAIVSGLIYDTYKDEINKLIEDMEQARKDGTFDEKYKEFQERYMNMMKGAAEDTEKFADIYGWASSKSSSLSSGIQSVTEDTADLLASYLNSIRADVSIIRTLMPNINENVIKMQADIAAINANTYRSANSTESIESIINQVIIGTKKLHVA